MLIVNIIIVIFVSVFEGVLKHYNKNEYFISEGTSVLLWDDNSFLSKTSDPVFKIQYKILEKNLVRILFFMQ